MIKNFGLFDAAGHVNVFVFQFVLMWGIILCPFIFRPIDMLMNFPKYIVGLPCYYFSYFWWYIIITIYSMCNLDDVSWGNRPSNASNGMNVVIDNIKRQEILKQSYRSTRTNILIGWWMANISVMYFFDSLVLSSVHNGNMSVKSTCQSIIKGYAIYACCNGCLVLFLSACHMIQSTVLQLMCSKYTPATIYKRPPVSNEHEAKVLLDDTDEEEFTPPVLQAYKKKGFSSKKGKSEFETDEDPSFFSDDIESHQFMQRYKKKGGWTY
jgi:hypothetical protein